MPADGGGRPARRNDYRAARLWAAGALTATVVFLLVFDALSSSYTVSEVALVTLLATILTLLGIEAAQHLPFTRRD